MSPVDERAEILRLARLLRTPPDELEFLLPVPDADLTLFREQVTESLFDAHNTVIKRLGAGAKLLPSAVLAKIGETVFGPLLCARIAGEIEPGKATDVARRLPVSFLTEVAIELDPRRVRGIIEKIPTDTVVAVAVELADRQDWITLGRFVGHLPQEKTAACLRRVSDSQVLRTAFAFDDVSAVATVIDLLPKPRLASLLRTASAERLWPTLLGIAERLRDDQVIELAGVLAGLDDAVLTGLLDVVVQHELWDKLLPLAAELPPEAQQVLADAAGRLPAETRGRIAQQAEALGVLGRLGPIADAVGEAAA